MVRPIVRISFVCVHLCATRVTLICPPVRMGVYGAYYLFIYLFLIFL